MKRVLLIAVLMICFSSVANAQNIICPEMYYFPKSIEDNFVTFSGTWWTAKYDPLNPNVSFIYCDKLHMECRIETAYISLGQLMMAIPLYYSIEKWDKNGITAIFNAPLCYKNILTIRVSDSSIFIVHVPIPSSDDLCKKHKESWTEYLKDGQKIYLDYLNKKGNVK
jgi:hypothetical protein